MFSISREAIEHWRCCDRLHHQIVSHQQLIGLECALCNLFYLYLCFILRSFMGNPYLFVLSFVCVVSFWSCGKSAKTHFKNRILNQLYMLFVCMHAISVSLCIQMYSIFLLRYISNMPMRKHESHTKNRFDRHRKCRL